MFFSLFSPSPPSPPPLVNFCRPEEDACCAGIFHNNPIIILHFTTWHKLNNVSGCVNIQHWFRWTAGPAVTPHLSQEVFLVLWFEPILTHWLFLPSDDSPAHPVEIKVTVFIPVLMVLEHYSQWLLVNQILYAQATQAQWSTVVHVVWCFTCYNMSSQPIQF